MKVRIDQDEFWPWHCFLDNELDKPFGAVYDVPDDMLERWRVALNEASKAQREISEFIGWGR